MNIVIGIVIFLAICLALGIKLSGIPVVITKLLKAIELLLKLLYWNACSNGILKNARTNSPADKAHNETISCRQGLAGFLTGLSGSVWTETKAKK